MSDGEKVAGAMRSIRDIVQKNTDPAKREEWLKMYGNYRYNGGELIEPEDESEAE